MRDLFRVTAASTPPSLFYYSGLVMPIEVRTPSTVVSRESDEGWTFVRVPDERPVPADPPVAPLGLVSSVASLVFLDPHPLILATYSDGMVRVWGVKGSPLKGLVVLTFPNQAPTDACFWGDEDEDYPLLRFTMLHSTPNPLRIPRDIACRFFPCVAQDGRGCYDENHPGMNVTAYHLRRETTRRILRRSRGSSALPSVDRWRQLPQKYIEDSTAVSQQPVSSNLSVVGLSTSLANRALTSGSFRVRTAPACGLLTCALSVIQDPRYVCQNPS